jgi:hypothetical protein
MGSALPVRRVFSPLDDELELLPGELTPILQKATVRLGAEMPFGRVSEFMEEILGISMSEATARRMTEEAGRAYLAVQDREVERLEREAPLAPQGAPTMLISLDGAMVPVEEGLYAEVKTLLIGVLDPPIWKVRENKAGEWEPQTRELSYFSRLSDSETFTRSASLEVDRRGITMAGVLVSTMDAAEWQQTYLDFYRPDTVRILDFPHAGERLHPFGSAVWGEETEEAKAWLSLSLSQLKRTGPAELLKELRMIDSVYPSDELRVNLAYLETREGRMNYPEYRVKGWPIASGAMESANKTTVQARLDRSGMHWARANVNPMLTLTNALSNRRWSEAWPLICAERRACARSRRRKPKPDDPKEVNVIQKSGSSELMNMTTANPMQQGKDTTRSVKELPLETKQPVVVRRAPRAPYKPAPNHPWRRPFLNPAKHHPLAC